ncbi:MAG: hypothetical protein Kow0029_30990 [Candidatus Rifleibacteriota bacterium]
MVTGPIKNNPYLQQVLFQNLSSTDIQPSQLKSSAQLISSSINAKAGIATISANGAKINNVGKIIRNSGDMQSYEGFQASIRRAGASSDPLQTIRLANSADYIARTKPQMLNDSFAALARNLGNNDNNLIDSFNSAFTSTVEKVGINGLQTFNRGIKAVENADYSNSSVTQSENLQKFFSTVRKINSAGENAEQTASNLDRLVRGAELNKNGKDIWNYFNDFTGPDPDNIG